MGFVQEFVEKSASNLGIEVPASSIHVSHSDESDAMYQLTKSSIWPLHSKLLQYLEVVPLDGDYKAFAQAYATVTWVYAAAWTIAAAIGNIPFLICTGPHDNPDVETEGDLYDLFEYPNEWESGQELFEDLS